MNRAWSNAVRRLLNSPPKKKTRVAHRQPPLAIEMLEDRTVPAIQIINGASGSGNLDTAFLATPGSFSAASGFISVGALESVAATTSISITSTSGGIEFTTLTSTLALQTGAGNSDTFTATNGGAITFDTPSNNLTTTGANLTFSAGGGSGSNLALANLGTGAGSVSLTTTNGSITTDAINSTGITANATGNIIVGGAITSSGAVTLTTSGGSITSSANVIQTSSQLALSANQGINVTTQAVQLSALNSGMSAAGDIVVTQTASPQQALAIVGAGVNNTVSGGRVSITNNGEAISLGTGINIQSNSGAITLTAADVQISGNINSGTALTWLAPTAGRQVDLGTNTVGKFGVTQAEIDNITASNLRIGSANSGTFTVTAPITVNTASEHVGQTLTLISGAAMTDTGTGAITATNLRLSGTGPITLNASNNVTNLVADLTASTPSGALLFSNDNNPLTIGAGIDGVTGITTNNSNVTLVANSLNIANPIRAAVVGGSPSAGGIVTLVPFTAATNITIGAAGAGLNITDTELSQITASIVRIGAIAADPGGSFAATTGTITVNGAVNRHLTVTTGFNTLDLETANATATAVTEGANTISVAKLAVQAAGSVVLNNNGNDVDSLAGSVTGGAGFFFHYHDTNGFTVDTVDGVAGITTSTGGTATNTFVSFQAGGAVTQTAGANITTNGLELLGAGSYALNNTGNDAGTLAAGLTTATTGTISYTDANALSIGTAGAAPTSGVITNNSAITIKTINGNLTVLNTVVGIDVNAGTSTVFLSAASAPGQDNAIILNNGINNPLVGGTGGITLEADNISIGSTAANLVEAGAGTLVVRPFQAGTLINLGGADSAGTPNTLGLTTAEISELSGGVIVIGRNDMGNAAGTITITQQINPPHTNQLELVTGAQIVDGGVPAPDLTVTRLGLIAGTGIGTSMTSITTSVSNLEATTATGGVFVANTGTALTIGGVDANLHGVQVTGASGDISLSNNNNINDNQSGEIVKGPGNITITTTGASNILTGGNNFGLAGNGAVDSTGGTVTLTAGQDLLIGDIAGAYGDVTAGGSISLSAGRNIVVDENSFVDAHGTGTVTATAGTGGTGNITMQQNGATGARITTQGGNITLTTAANGTFTAGSGNASGDLQTTQNGGNGNITINADHIVLTDKITSGTGITTIQQVTGTEAIQLGTATDGELDLSTTELGNITASTLRIGNTANSGNITVTAAVSVPNATTLSLRTGGSISDSAPSDTTTVNSLAAQAAAGISLDTVVSNAAFNNTGGAVRIANTGSLTITSLDGVMTSSNTGTTTNLSAASPLIFAVNTTSAGTLTVTTTETAVEMGPPEDDITVNSGVIVQSTGGDVDFTSGDSIILQSTSQVISLTGAVNFIAGMGDTDNDASVTLNGTISASTGVSISEPGDMIINQNITTGGPIFLSAGGALMIGPNVTIKSTTGGLITLESNQGVPAGTKDITFGANDNVLTTGTVDIYADPDLNGVGGGINLLPTDTIAGPGATQATNINLNAGKNITATNLSATNNITITTSANILGDGSNSTVINAGNNISLTAGGVIGGNANTKLTASDIESASTATPTAEYQSLLDVEYGGTLALAQTGSEGNIGIRVLNAGGLNLSTVTGASGSLIGVGNQLALVSVNGDLTDNTNFTMNGANNADLFLATVSGHNVVLPNNTTSIVNNGATALTTLMASGSASAAIVTPVQDNTANINAQNLFLATTGGAIGAPSSGTTGALEFKAATLNGFTNGTINNVAQSGGNAFLTATANGVTIGQFNAGSGNVTLTSLGDIPSGTGAGSSIISANPNSGTAAIIGGTVTLDTHTAPTSGATGQIGYFTGGAAQFFEVQATTINATTNNSRVWISAINGSTVGQINVGNDTAVLKTVNGILLGSQMTTSTADVTAGQQVVLIGSNGGFGNNITSLQINSPILSANVTSGTGNIDVLGINAGGLTVNAAKTVSGAVNVGASVGNLQIGSATATGTVVSATGTVVLDTSVGNVLFGTGASTGPLVSTTGEADITSAGNITDAAPTGVLDVVAATLALSAGTAIGSSGNSVTTQVGTLAADAGNGGVFVTNTGNLTIGTVSSFSGVIATTSGNIAVTTAGSMTVSQNVTGVADVTLSTTDGATPGDDLTVSAGTTVSTASGGNVNLQAGDNLTVNGTVTTSGAGITTLAGDVGGTDGEPGATINLTSGTFNSGHAVVVQGNTNSDTFMITPSATVAFSIAANTPTAPPGDVLVLNLTGATGTTYTPTAIGNGGFTFTNRDAVNFTSIETINATGGQFGLKLDMTALGFTDGNASPDVVGVSTTAGGVLNVTVQENSTGTPLSFFSGLASGVNGFMLVGGADSLKVNVDETNPGIPTATLQGGSTTAGPGNTLNINTTNVSSTSFIAGAPGSGTYTFGNRNSVSFSGFQSVTPSVITVVASLPNASERGSNQTPQPGQFTLTRTGDLSSALTVGYNLGGTAVNGVDYQAIGYTVTFAAGSATATVDINVLNNSIIDGTRTVVLSLFPGTGYTFQPGASATVSIADNDSVNHRYATAAAVTGAIQVFDNGSTNPTFSFIPYPGYQGALSVAVGDVNGDGVSDFATAVATAGAPAAIKVYDGATGTEILSFIAFPGYMGGLSIALGDFTGNGQADIVVGTLVGSPTIAVFDGRTGAQISGFSMFPGQNLPVGVNVAVADFNNDGKDEIIAGLRGIVPHVKVFDIAGNQLQSFYAFDPTLGINTGITVAGGSLTGSGPDQIIVGAVFNGQNVVNVFSVNGTLEKTLPLPAANPTNSISSFGPPVATADLTGSGKENLLVTIGPILDVFDGTSFGLISQTTIYPGYQGGIYVG